MQGLGGAVPQAGVGGKPTIPSEARQLQGQAERGSDKGKQSAAAICRKGKWKLALLSVATCPKSGNLPSSR